MFQFPILRLPRPNFTRSSRGGQDSHGATASSPNRHLLRGVRDELTSDGERHYPYRPVIATRLPMNELGDPLLDVSP